MKKQPPMQRSMVEPEARMRITYSTSGAIRYTGNLDLHRIWERAFRRAALPISYSHGFHPQPRLQLASALPLGITSRQEFADIWLDETVNPEEVMDRLNRSLPAGVRVEAVTQVDLKEKALQTRMTNAVYQITMQRGLSSDILERAVEAFLAKAEILRERRGKTYNLRPLVERITIEPANSRVQDPGLVVSLSAREGATGRPEEVLSALGFDPQAATIVRTALYYD